MRLEWIGQTLSAVLAVGALLHGYGSFIAFDGQPSALVWSVASAAFALFLAVLAVHANRTPVPAATIVILVGGLAAWFATVLAFGLAIGNPLDPRVAYHLLVSGALSAELLTLARRRRG